MTVVHSFGADIHYDVAGSGFPVLMLAGSAFAAATWPAELIASLQSKFTVITYDQRGTGRSIPMGEAVVSTKLLAIDALAVLTDAGFERAHVVGHSMGGMVAQQLAAMFPENVASLVLAASSAGLPAPIPPARAGIPLGVASELIEMGFEEFSVSKHHEVFFTPHALKYQREMVERFDAIFLETAPSVRDYLRLVAARTGHSSQAAAKNFEMPVLLMVGDQDLGGFNETRVDMTEKLASLIPHARLEYVRGQSHCLLWEEPAYCSQLIHDFLD